jgi:exodeoxyribonuclease-3
MEEYLVRILTWNINGIRAALKKNVWESITNLNADIICLQEIKGRPEQLPAEFQEFHLPYSPVWNPAARPGYSGVATFLKKPAQEVILGLSEERFDVEGRVVQTIHDGFRLFNIYFPNGQRDQGRLTYKLEFYEHLLEYCKRLHADGEQIILCGDFNTAHQEIDLRNPKENETTSGFLPEERAWVDRYLEHGFVDIYRRMYPDRVQYTWWTYITNARLRNVGWRLDYFLISPGLVERIQDVTIYDEILGSDHCPVSLDLN